jgi:hypothetical protein
MENFSADTTDFAYPHRPQREWDEKRGHYIPDAIISAFLNAARPKTIYAPLANNLQGIKTQIRKPQIDLKESFGMVTAAISKYHPGIMDKIDPLISPENMNPQYWDVRPIDPQKEEFPGGHCGIVHDQNGNLQNARVFYRYGNSIQDPIYLAHEYGHLVAMTDKINQTNGQKAAHQYDHMTEIQGFFTQHVMYDFLSTHPDALIQAAAQAHMAFEIGFCIIDIHVAHMLFKLYKINSSIVTLSTEGRLNFNIPDEDQKEKLISYLEKELEEICGQEWKVCFQDYPKWFIDPKGFFMSMERTHRHAIASMIAKGLFDLSKGMSPAEKITLWDQLMDIDTPQKSISEILNANGIRSTNDLSRFAEKTVQSIGNAIESSVNIPTF